MRAAVIGARGLSQEADELIPRAGEAENPLRGRWIVTVSAHVISRFCVFAGQTGQVKHTGRQVSTVSTVGTLFLMGFRFSVVRTI
jgi:hypothetical protein